MKEYTFRMRFSSDQVTGTRFSFEHTFPSKFFIYLEHCPRGEAVITGHLRLSSMREPARLKKTAIPAIYLCPLYEKWLTCMIHCPQSNRPYHALAELVNIHGTLPTIKYQQLAYTIHIHLFTYALAEVVHCPQSNTSS